MFSLSGDLRVIVLMCLRIFRKVKNIFKSLNSGKAETEKLVDLRCHNCFICMARCCRLYLRQKKSKSVLSDSLLKLKSSFESKGNWSEQLDLIVSSGYGCKEGN